MAQFTADVAVDFTKDFDSFLATLGSSIEFSNVTPTAFDAIDRLRATLQSHPLHPAVKILEPGTSFVLPTVAV